MSETSCDHRRRLDEISALESIFCAEEIKRSEEHGPSAGQFHANVEVAEGFCVVTKKGEALDKVVEVSFLPPIVLHYSLPERYPSDPASPPSFTLACHWLDRAQLGRLCKQLDFLWRENHVDGQGSEILFAWAHFLKNESLDFLEIRDRLDVSFIENVFYRRRLARERKSSDVVVDAGEADDVAEVGAKVREPRAGQWVCREPGGGNEAWTCFQRTAPKPKKTVLDRRAVLDLTPGAASVFEPLSAHDLERRTANFCRQTHLCNVCYETRPGHLFTRFSPCGHILCSPCARTYFATAVEGGNVQNIRCPEARCDSEAQFDQIKEHLGPELFLRYDRMLLDATLAMMGDIVPCPRPTCQYSVTVEGGDEKLATCFHCRYAFCVDCRMGYHGVEPCRFKATEERRLVEEYRDAGDKRRAELEKRYSKRRLEELVQTSMTREWIEDNSKKCPHCRASIQKSFGCNKMVCLKCNTHFCWLCSVKLDPAFPYLHFNRPASQCYNLLFQGVEVDDEEFFDPPELDWLEDEELYI